jgi:hypothetical protein
MIVYGAEDTGVLDYISFIKKEISKGFYNIKSINQIDRIKKKISLVITGSAFKRTSLDQKIIRWSKKKNILSVSIVDHWYNFKERFINKFNLPDYVFLNDKASFEKIKSLHPSIESKLIVGGNPIFTSFKKKIKLKKVGKKKIIFFVSEKLSKKFENQKIIFIKKILQLLPIDYKLYIKLHPREKNNTYSLIKSKKVSILREYSFKKILLDSKIIIGIRSILLIKCAIFRDDILSLNIKDLQEKDFIPYQKKWLYPVENISNFKNIFREKVKISNLKPNIYFNNRLFNLIKINSL